MKKNLSYISVFSFEKIDFLEHQPYKKPPNKTTCRLFGAYTQNDPYKSFMFCSGFFYANKRITGTSVKVCQPILKTSFCQRYFLLTYILKACYNL